MSEKVQPKKELITQTIYHNENFQYSSSEKQLMDALIDLKKKEAKVREIQKQIDDQQHKIDKLKKDLKSSKAAVWNSRQFLRGVVVIYKKNLDDIFQDNQ
ncbi:hypothetical protein M9Y10_024459 [Tritrichomonas musculus]|uniref:Uncharacterized protein n=1 Tax=Tritrichomonas musculus TaxID=1915356 RepID=A0ABR2HC17_9EUKA